MNLDIQDIKSSIKQLHYTVGSRSTGHVHSGAVESTSRPQTWASVVVETDSFLRKLGLYGSFVRSSTQDCISKYRFRLGYQFPTWFWRRSLDFDLQLASMPSGLGLEVLPGYIRLQNRVPENFPFMVACRNGDIALIKQHLNDGTGDVHDRTICTGTTPLMVRPY